jgi:hypothetical protein
MLGDLIALFSIGSLAMAPLVWRARQDKREAAALKVQAGLQFKANQRLGGESFLVVLWSPPAWAARAASGSPLRIGGSGSWARCGTTWPPRCRPVTSSW